MLNCHSKNSTLCLERIITILKEWNNTEEYNIVFDSCLNDWSVGSEDFYDSIKDKENIFFIVIDDDMNVFGGFKKQPIDMADTFVQDDDAYVFTMNIYGSIPVPTRFYLSNDWNKEVFYVGSSLNPCLFAFGKGDLVVYKKDGGFRSACIQCSFDYCNAPVVLCGSTRFTTRRVIVIQM